MTSPDGHSTGERDGAPPPALDAKTIINLALPELAQVLVAQARGGSISALALVFKLGQVDRNFLMDFADALLLADPDTLSEIAALLADADLV